MRQGLTSNARLFLLSFAILACFGVVAARLGYLHWYRRDAYLAFIAKARYQLTVEPAQRGDILDRRGNVLATSRTLVELGVDQLALRREDEGKWAQLAALLGVPEYELAQLMRPHRKPAARPVIDLSVVEQPPEPKRWVRLSEGIEESVYDRVLALGIRGVYGQRQYRRTYPKGQLASHLVGYVNKEDKPAAGVEAYMDFYLRGQVGWKEGERDGQRRELAQFRTREVAPTPGYSVVLTIDEFLQQAVETELEAIARKFRPEAATIIVGRPQSGEILALGNWPTFNLNEFNSAPLEHQRNIAITDQYEPGSAFKIVATAGALADGVVNPGTVFDCDLTAVEVRGKMRNLPREAHAAKMGKLTVAGIVAKSSNRGAAQIGILLGEQRLYEWARAFGFGEPTGFPFGGETSGVLHRPERWDGLTITRLPIGHAVAATPLQVHGAMSVIANGGALVRPWLIREIRDPMGRIVAEYEPLPRRQVVPAAIARQMAGFLIEAASAEGTGQAAAIEGYHVAGKTGTTQMIVDGQYSEKNHVGTFCGFFPAENPELVITVVVKNGHPEKGLAYGGVVAAPSFKHLGEQFIAYLDIPPAHRRPATGRSAVASATLRP